MLVITARPRPPTPTAAMLRRSLGAWNPRPSTWRGTIVNPAVARPTVERNLRRERPAGIAMGRDLVRYLISTSSMASRLGPSIIIAR